MRFRGQAYGIIPNPKDGSVWFAQVLPDVVPGQIFRLDPKTCVTERYEPPYGIDQVPQSEWGHGPRGVDIDTNGIVWTALSGSGHIASFDRSKCKILNGPKATGQHCAEGWTLHRTPGPKLQGATLEENADFHYYIWVDQFNTLGLGEERTHRQWHDFRLAYRLVAGQKGDGHLARTLSPDFLYAWP